ncbi:MAG: Mur ligase family protein, partial [Eubacteriales bacterium]
MELFDIISKKDIVNSDKITGSIKTSGVCCDTRKLKTGEVFFAIPGEKDDGRGYIAEAYAKGAAAIVTENNIESRLKIPTIKVRNIRESFCRASFAVLENPQKKIKVIGITGTNGKTTIANLLRKVISDAGKKCAMFSTVEYDVCGAVYPSLHTTPPPETLAPLFAEAAKNGAEYAVMEVSSHAIAQKRVAAIDFDIGIFTNITRDHIDYHKTIEEYTRIKASLFSSCKNSIINADDKRAKEIASCAEKNIY